MTTPTSDGRKQNHDDEAGELQERLDAAAEQAESNLNAWLVQTKIKQGNYGEDEVAR